MTFEIQHQNHDPWKESVTLLKFKKVCSVKGIVKKSKDKPQRGRKDLQNTSNKRRVSKIWKDLLKHNNRIAKYPPKIATKIWTDASPNKINGEKAYIKILNISCLEEIAN